MCKIFERKVSIDLVFQKVCAIKTRMIRYIFIWLCCCIVFHRNTLAQNVPIQPQVKNFLGTKAASILSEAETVQAFLLDPFPNASATEQFNGFKVLKKSTLSAKNSTIIKTILGTDAHYGFDQLMKNCTFTPSLGLRFYKNGQTLDVLICLDCDVWRFIGYQLNKTEDFDPAHQQVREFILMAFPK